MPHRARSPSLRSPARWGWIGMRASMCRRPELSSLTAYNPKLRAGEGGMREWAVALAALWMVMGSPPVSLGAEGVTLPKDLPLPTDASVAIYLPKHIREFRNPFRSGGGFQTTNALQLGASFEELTLGAAQHFFKTDRKSTRLNSSH